MTSDLDAIRALLAGVWVLAAGVLVFFMQAGFALVESGLVRAKNAVNVIMKNYMDMCVGALGFWAIGYGLMFGKNPTGLFGQDKFFLTTAPPNEFLYMFFQMMFAATAATIVSGALAERIRYSAYLIGSFLITMLIYPTFGAWAWNSGGWLNKQGFLDFAGSTVVHSMGAWCALAGILALGPRIGRFGPDGKARDIPGHSLPFVAMGGFILWFGWFGFNCGSVAALDLKDVDLSPIGKIALNTHLAACAGAVSTMITLIMMGRPILLSLVVNGSLGGLVSITAPCVYVTPGSAILIGIVGGCLVPLAGAFLDSLQIDDAVGAIPVHGFCGAWGTLAVALFYAGDPVNTPKLSVQAMGVAAAFLVAFPSAFLMYCGISVFTGLRVSSIQEQRGLDYAEHAEIGYPEFQEGQLYSGSKEME